MIIEVSGDIVLTDSKVICHGVAPNDSFNQGLAFTLREQWPAMYKDFRHYCKVSHPKAGEIWTWGSANGGRIVCLFTQEAAYNHGEKPGKATTHYVNNTLKALKTLVLKEKFSSIAIPRLATGVGGLEWDDVYPLLEKHLGDLNIPIYVYVKYEQGVKAKEAKAA